IDRCAVEKPLPRAGDHHRERLLLHCFAPMCGARQLHLDGVPHDVAGGDHEDDQEDQADIDQRRDVDAGDRLVALLKGLRHGYLPSPLERLVRSARDSPGAIAFLSGLARPTERRTSRWKKLKPSTAGMATNRPTAVATSASLMPPITACAPPLPAADRSAKARMMPSTVPKRPMNGALLPRVPRMERRCSYSMRFFSTLAAVAMATATGPLEAAPSAARTTSASRLAPDATLAAAARFPARHSCISSGNFEPIRRLKKYAPRSSATATLSTLSPTKSQRTQPAPSRVKLSSRCESTRPPSFRERTPPASRGVTSIEKGSASV